MVLLPSTPTTHGPVSPLRAVSVELSPGPPARYMTSGAFSGSILASKNKKYVLMSKSTVRSVNEFLGRWTKPENVLTPGVVSQRSV